MLLTKDEIAVIEKAADLLDGWLKNLISDNFGEMGCFIPLHAWYETHIIQAVDILIDKMPQLGMSIKADCDDLLKKAESLSSIGEQDSSEFQRKQADLSLLARRIIPRFRGATSGKWRRIIGWIVEGIITLALLIIFSYFFGLATGIFVLAALFTIFHLLGWLDPIKAFIDKILSHK
ncbi:MAG: hypothetical protein ABIL62_14815 [Planctomycetota bacterium]